MHQIYVIKYWIIYCILEYEWVTTSLPFYNYSFQVYEKSLCLLKFLAPLPWQPNLIKTLVTGAISKLMIQTSKPIPTYTLLNPVTYFEHGILNVVYMPQIFHFPD